VVPEGRLVVASCEDPTHRAHPTPRAASGKGPRRQTSQHYQGFRRKDSDASLMYRSPNNQFFGHSPDATTSFSAARARRGRRSEPVRRSISRMLARWASRRRSEARTRSLLSPLVRAGSVNRVAWLGRMSARATGETLGSVQTRKNMDHTPQKGSGTSVAAPPPDEASRRLLAVVVASRPLTGSSRRQHRPATPVASSDACRAVKVTGEPDAGKPHVRFDEGVLASDHGRAREAPPDERGGNR